MADGKPVPRGRAVAWTEEQIAEMVRLTPARLESVRAAVPPAGRPLIDAVAEMSDEFRPDVD